MDNLHQVLSYLSSPGGTTERIDVYIAHTDSSMADGLHGCDHEGEDIKVVRVKRAQARQWLSDGTMNNAAGIIALQHFFLHEADYVAADIL